MIQHQRQTLRQGDSKKSQAWHSDTALIQTLRQGDSKKSQAWDSDTALIQTLRQGDSKKSQAWHSDTAPETNTETRRFQEESGLA